MPDPRATPPSGPSSTTDGGPSPSGGSLTRIRTTERPATKTKPARVVVAVLSGPEQGSRESYRDAGPGAHIRSVKRLLKLLGVRGEPHITQHTEKSITWEVTP